MFPACGLPASPPPESPVPCPLSPRGAQRGALEARRAAQASLRAAGRAASGWVSSRLLLAGRAKRGGGEGTGGFAPRPLPTPRRGAPHYRADSAGGPHAHPTHVHGPPSRRERGAALPCSSLPAPQMPCTCWPSVPSSRVLTGHPQSPSVTEVWQGVRGPWAPVPQQLRPEAPGRTPSSQRRAQGVPAGATPNPEREQRLCPPWEQ